MLLCHLSTTIPVRDHVETTAPELLGRGETNVVEEIRRQ